MVNSRRKGHNFERGIARVLRSIWPEAKRGYQSRPTDTAPDVDGTPFWIECKVGAAPRIWQAIDQARRDTDGRPWVVIARRDRGTITVTMDLTTFLSLVKKETT